MQTAEKLRITVQVLNGATGEIREVIARVAAETEQEAVDKLFACARQDDYYYRFLGHRGVIDPSIGDRHSFEHEQQVYWVRD